VPRDGQGERMNRTIKKGEAGQGMIRGIILPLNVERLHRGEHGSAANASGRLHRR